VGSGESPHSRGLSPAPRGGETLEEAKLKVTLVGILRHLAGTGEEDVDLPPAASVRDLLRLLARRHGQAFEDELFEPGGELNRNLRVIAGNTDVEQLDGLDTPLDRAVNVAMVLIIPQFGGG